MGDGRRAGGVAALAAAVHMSNFWHMSNNPPLATTPGKKNTSQLDEKCEEGAAQKLGGRLVKINERRYGRGFTSSEFEFLVSVGKRRHLETAKRGGITTQNKWTK